MNTSGLLIVAKNGFVQDQIIHQMKAGITEKKYLAVVDGIIQRDQGTVRAPIGRPDPNEVERWILPADKGGLILLLTTKSFKGILPVIPL